MIFNVTGGGGGTGCTLTITAPVGATVTVSKDNKAKPSKVATTGTVIFRGLETGTWTITISNGTDTASKPVEIKADYSAEIAFFSATINVTYPAGSTCTATDGVTTLNAPDTSGTWVCVVPNVGTWTISCTDGQKTANATVAITAEGQTESKTLAYILYLFRAGDGALTDFSITLEVDITKDYIYKKWSNGDNCYYTSDLVDLTPYSTLHFDVEVVGKYESGGKRHKCGVHGTTKPTGGNNYSGFTAFSKLPEVVTARKTYDIDITTITKGIVALKGVPTTKTYNIWAD